LRIGSSPTRIAFTISFAFIRSPSFPSGSLTRRTPGFLPGFSPADTADDNRKTAPPTEAGRLARILFVRAQKSLAADHSA
jgi:hypothetical protein